MGFFSSRNEPLHREALERARLVIARYKVRQFASSDGEYSYRVELAPVDRELRGPMTVAIRQLAQQVFELNLAADLGKKQLVELALDNLAFVDAIERGTVPEGLRRQLRQEFYEDCFYRIGLVDGRPDVINLETIVGIVDGATEALNWYDTGEAPYQPPLRPQPGDARKSLKTLRENIGAVLGKEMRRLETDSAEPFIFVNLPPHRIHFARTLLSKEMPGASDEQIAEEDWRRDLIRRRELLARLAPAFSAEIELARRRAQ